MLFIFWNIVFSKNIKVIINIGFLFFFVYLAPSLKHFFLKK